VKGGVTGGEEVGEVRISGSDWSVASQGDEWNGIARFVVAQRNRVLPGCPALIPLSLIDKQTHTHIHTHTQPHHFGHYTLRSK